MRPRFLVCAVLQDRFGRAHEPGGTDRRTPHACRSAPSSRSPTRSNGKTVIVRINDRGPFIKGRVIDLSKAAAKQLGFIASGQTNICMVKT